MNVKRKNILQNTVILVKQRD